MSVSELNTTDPFDEFIHGDDFYNSIFEELESPFTGVNVPSFCCLGEVSVREIQVNKSSYFYSKYSPKNLSSRQICTRGKKESICLFGKTWDKGSCLFNHLNELFKLASMELMILDEASLLQSGSVVAGLSDDNKRNYFQIRKDFIELCLFVDDFLSRLLSFPEYHWALQNMVDKVSGKLNSLRLQLGKITQLPEYIYQFCANSAGNKCEEAGYHVVHCRFDFLWLDLHLSTTLERASKSSQPLHLQRHYYPLFREIFDLAILRFNKIDQRDLPKKSPFSCTCVQEMWIMLQILADSDLKNNCEKGFWSLFENMILSFLKRGITSPEESMDNSPFKLDSSHFEEHSSYLFSIWFTYNVGKLYTFNDREVVSCFPLLEHLMKNLLRNEISELELRTFLYFVEKLCLELWEPKTEPLLILWEYFQKRLNNLFYVPGQDLDTVATLGKTALNLLSQVKETMEDPYSIRNSFQHFLRIVGLHLKRCGQSKNQRHWNLMTGRIYSKLTPPKLLSLNQTGEHHFVCLFLTLALSADLNQVTNKFSDLCVAYTGSKGVLGTELLKGLLALCLLSIERGKSISCMVPPLTRCLISADINKDKELFSITIDAFSDILDHHHSLSLGQHLFIDSWITKFLSACSQTESMKLLDVLLSFVIRVRRLIDLAPNKEMEDLVEGLWSQLGTYLMSSTLSNCLILADIAANLASIYLNLSKSSHFTNIVSLFSNNQLTDVRLVQRFITQLLDNDCTKYILKDVDNLIIETWLRSNIVICDVDVTEMKSLNKVMADLSEIKQICGEDTAGIFQSEDPLLEFFSVVHSKYRFAAVDSQRIWLSNKISNYLKDLDKWLKPIIVCCQSAQQISKIYLTVGSTFSLISNLLYTKSKPNSLVQSVISLMLLPVSAFNSEVKIHQFIVSAIRKTLHLFLRGLNNLGPSSDPYIGRCVKECITIYIPRCLSNVGPLASQIHISTFSLASLFNEFEPSLARLILENLALVFFKPKSRNPLPNSIQAVRYIKEIISLHSTCENVLLAVSNHSIEQICDIIMYCDSKTSLYILSKDVTQLFFENSLLTSNKIISDNVEDVLSRLCTSNLAWSSRPLFDLLYLLCSYIPLILKRFLPKLLEHIKLIETKRGVANDKILRSSGDNRGMKGEVSLPLLKASSGELRIVMCTLSFDRLTRWKPNVGNFTLHDAVISGRSSSKLLHSWFT